MKRGCALVPIISWKAIHLAIPVIIGVMIVISGLLFSFSGEKTNFDEIALGKETQSLFSSYKDFLIHCNHLEDAYMCLEGVQQRNLSKSALWLGNSQVHAVNKLQAGQENAPPILFRFLQKTGIDLITFSQPNANLQEHYVLFEYLKKRLLNLQLLILPVVFDDLREDGIRLEIAQAFIDVNIKTTLEQTEIGHKILVTHSENVNIGEDMPALKDTFQERSEKILNNWLNNHSSLWASRPEIRGNLLLSLYLLRNTVFGIKATSKRRMIRSRYSNNMAALLAIIDSAKVSNIEILLYIVPIRNDVEIPYVLKEYNTFKEEIKQLSIDENIAFINLETLVASKFWGLKASTIVGGTPELDFMHFQALGHELLADALFKAIRKYIFSKHDISKP